MRCPYCKTETEPGTPACQRCGLELEKVTRLFGVVPRIVKGISDDACVLSDSAKRRIRTAANELSIRFPQTNFSVVTAKLPADTSLGVFAFWIFNEAGIARDLDRASNNYDILLTIDPSTGRANLMVGYGLESFVSEAQLAAIIEETRAFYERGEYAHGIDQTIAGLRESLTDVVENLESTHGVTPIVKAKSFEVATSPTDY